MGHDVPGQVCMCQYSTTFQRTTSSVRFKPRFCHRCVTWAYGSSVVADFELMGKARG